MTHSPQNNFLQTITEDLTQQLTCQRRNRIARIVGSTGFFAVVAFACYLVLLGQGTVKMSPAEVLDVLRGGGTARQIAVVWDLRLPVALATMIVGAALGTAGAWTQTMARNPLASPDILGVTSGAAVLVVLGTVTVRPTWLEDLPMFWWRAGLAMVGAVAVLVVLTLLGGVGTSDKIVLIGFALSLMLQAVVSYLLLKAEILRAAETQTWLAGSTGFVRMNALIPLLVGLAPFIAIGLWCARDLPVLAHDDSSASSLGVNIKARRAALLIAATGVAAVVVSVVGPIGFIALIAPHLGRIVANTGTPSPMVSAAAGAALLGVCAVIAGFIPTSAPVGAVSSVIGGIALVGLVIKKMNKRGNNG
ncbi:iron ABC transporter permease [Corynebacterium glucuronolyticum]|uniref:Iron ABC transporter permease n=1 Tax=Corynebacterium glucuronolyticum TaxID=39791 RepID=A0A7T4JVF8_9CORY|nr:iron ABC transporter permease [Corynebacterium glucuronolyticum]QQB46847.1 iron ABC transporter permease [Corynebacterium glucuronolyticum]WKD62307.1 putative siderophore transport system permease protein YfhA [Corynebacterium glucuronolyticum DSM 44120]SMB86968.1 iron complex transport system permease protein [Corynebacterium glucuronolyticum]